MQEKNNQTIIKILIGVIIGLSTVILFSGIFYILNMQGKIAKLETEQEEQLKRQIESQNMASIQTIQPQQNEKQQPQLSQTKKWGNKNTFTTISNNCIQWNKYN